MRNTPSNFPLVSTNNEQALQPDKAGPLTPLWDVYKWQTLLALTFYLATWSIFIIRMAAAKRWIWRKDGALACLIRFRWPAAPPRIPEGPHWSFTGHRPHAAVAISKTQRPANVRKGSDPFEKKAIHNLIIANWSCRQAVSHSSRVQADVHKFVKFVLIKLLDRVREAAGFALT